MTTTYRPNSRFYPDDDLVWNTPNNVLTEDIEKARQHLAKAIEVKGEDYVYINDTEANPPHARECLYLRYEKINYEGSTEPRNQIFINPKGPSCIVGHVFVYGEIPFDKITECEGDNAANACETLGAFSPIVAEALNQAQGRQDNPNGYTWGEAVEEFEAYIAEHTVRVEA